MAPARLEMVRSSVLTLCFSCYFSLSSPQLSEAIGVREVYVAWRSSWLQKLYLPQPLPTNRIKEGAVINCVEDTMVHAQTGTSTAAMWTCTCAFDAARLPARRLLCPSCAFSALGALQCDAQSLSNRR